MRLRGDAIPTRRALLCLGLLLFAVAAVVGCQQSGTDIGAEEQGRINRVAQDYVLQMKGWQPGEFRIEPHGLSADGAVAVVWAVHSADERSRTPGGGLSLALHVDRRSLQVIRELRFQ